MSKETSEEGLSLKHKNGICPKTEKKYEKKYDSPLFGHYDYWKCSECSAELEKIVRDYDDPFD